MLVGSRSWVAAAMLAALTPCCEQRKPGPAPSTQGDTSSLDAVSRETYVTYLRTADRRKVTEVVKTAPAEGPALRVCGGRAMPHYSLEVEGGETITEPSRLAEAMGGIKTPEQAVAFLWAVQCSLVPTVQGQHQKAERTSAGAWRVQVFRRPTAGCSAHPAYRVDFSLDDRGTFKELSSVQVDQGGDVSCGD